MRNNRERFNISNMFTIKYYCYNFFIVIILFGQLAYGQMQVTVVTNVVTAIPFSYPQYLAYLFKDTPNELAAVGCCKKAIGIEAASLLLHKVWLQVKKMGNYNDVTTLYSAIEKMEKEEFLELLNSSAEDAADILKAEFAMFWSCMVENELRQLQHVIPVIDNMTIAELKGAAKYVLKNLLAGNPMDIRISAFLGAINNAGYAGMEALGYSDTVQGLFSEVVEGVAKRSFYGQDIFASDPLTDDIIMGWAVGYAAVFIYPSPQVHNVCAIPRKRGVNGINKNQDKPNDIANAIISKGDELVECNLQDHVFE